MSIVAFAGRKQSGKTSACKFVADEFNQYNTKHKWLDGRIYNETKSISKIYNFADPLKQLCIDILGVKHEQCYGTDDNKNELVDCYWPGTDSKMTAREVLQYVGTDIFRNMQRNVWSLATIRLIEKEKPSLALIADCRFPNEVEAVKKAGGIVIKLKRSPYESDHKSETALEDDVYDQSNFDLIIDNDNIEIEEKNKIIHKFLIQTKRVLPL